MLYCVLCISLCTVYFTGYCVFHCVLCISLCTVYFTVYCVFHCVLCISLCTVYFTGYCVFHCRYTQSLAKVSASLILAILRPSVCMIHRNPVFNFTKYKNPTFKSKMLVMNINEQN